MDIKQNLSLPREVYTISDGQIVIVSPKQSVDRVDLRAANTIVRVCSRLKIEMPQIVFIHTEKREYHHKIFSKPFYANNNGCVWMYSAYHVKAFIEAYFDLPAEDIVKALYLKKDTWISRQPVLIPVGPDVLQKIQERERQEIVRRIQNMDDIADNPSFSELEHSLEFLTTRVPSKEEIIKQLEGILSDAVYKDYDIDYEEIIERIKREKKRDFKLRFDHDKKDSNRGCYGRFDIYVSDTAKLNLTAIHKALYLSFLLSEEGELLDDPSIGFYEVFKAIYNQMPNKVQDGINGIKGKDYIETQTINGYRTEIRNAIKKHIANKNIVDEFAIEGYKGKPFKIKRSCQDIRNEIMELFDLQ